MHTEVAAGEARLAASLAAARQLHSLATGLLGASAAETGQGASARAGVGALIQTLQPTADAGGVVGGCGSMVAPARALRGLGTREALSSPLTPAEGLTPYPAHAQGRHPGCSAVTTRENKRALQ